MRFFFLLGRAITINLINCKCNFNERRILIMRLNIDTLKEECRLALNWSI